MNLIVDKICIVIISIVGEETYKIYSKKVFNKEVEIDTNVDDEIEDLSASIKEVAESIDVEIPNEPAPKKRLKSKIVRFETHEASYITYNSHMPLLRKVDKSNEKEESNSN